MKRVLIIQSTLPEYRVPVFNHLSKKCELTLLVPNQPKIETAVDFKIDVVPEKHIPRFGRYFACNLSKKIEEYDVCISQLSVNYLQVIKHLYSRRKCKLILWGIGVAAGYGVPYDSKKSYRKILYQFIKRADAAVFYSYYPKEVYLRMGINGNKMFVANNTVQVLPQKTSKPSYLLFIGSLYPEKGIDILINQYHNAYNENHDVEDLYVVGDGTERRKSEDMCRTYGISHKVHFLGAIYEERQLSELFSQAIVCISPNQAGLSVLKSMGYGVPFVTRNDAITGGERFNIINENNGRLYESDEDLKSIILDIYDNKAKYFQYGLNAKAYYDKFRTVDQMSDSFSSAIEYVSQE